MHNYILLRPEDLESIVESVKKDVDHHLKMAYAGRRMDSFSLPDLPELASVVENTKNGKEYSKFMKMMQDSIHHHFVKNLGQPSDVENGGPTTFIKPTLESPITLFNIYSDEVSRNADDHSESSSEVYKIRVGSTIGVPGVDFPDYTDIPITSFTCSKKPHLPGFYADLDTGCQVFHVCWSDRRESFLCPMGTTFNQALRVCDYWYNSNCSLAPYYYTVNEEVEPDLFEAKNESASSMKNTLFEETASVATQKPDSSTYSHTTSDSIISFISQFIPIKVKIAVYPKTATQRLKIVSTTSIGDGKKSDFKQKPRQKSLYPSKHSRKPRSLEYSKSELDAEMLKIERTLIRFYESLDRAIMDIENDESVSKLSERARSIAKFVKSFYNFWLFKPLEDISPEPGTELYEHDMFIKEKYEGEDEMWKEMLVFIATFIERPEDATEEEMEVQHEVPEDMDERETLNPEPLTNLNPRFIVNPSVEQIPQLQSQEMPTFVNRAKRSAIISNPLKFKGEDRLNIHPETKKMLLKSYVKLFKTKHA